MARCTVPFCLSLHPSCLCFFFMCVTFPPAWHIVHVARVTDLLLDVWLKTAQREARHCCVPRTFTLRACSVSHVQSDGKNVKLTSLNGPDHDSSEDLQFIRAVQGHPPKVTSILPGCTYIVLQEGYQKYFYHVGGAYGTFMIPNSGLIRVRSKHPKGRNATFCTLVYLSTVKKNSRRTFFF